MSNAFDELFSTTSEPELHPAARAWIERIKRGQQASVEVVRRRDGLSYRPAKLYITFVTDHGPEIQHDDWDPYLSEVLARHGIRASVTENEALRLALTFQEWFGYPARKYGDDYMNSVLVEYVRGSSFIEHKVVADLMQDIHTSPPSKGHACSECLTDTTTVLAKGAKMLTESLKYGRETAEDILVRALAQYLDDRFGVTHRTMLGLK